MIKHSDGKASGPEPRPGGGRGRKGGRKDWKSRLLQVNIERSFMFYPKSEQMVLGSFNCGIIFMTFKHTFQFSVTSCILFVRVFFWGGGCIMASAVKRLITSKIKLFVHIIYSQVHKYWDIDTILTFLALYTTTMDFK